MTGDEPFLKHEVLRAIRRGLCGEGDGQLAWQVLAGKEAEWADVMDSVASLSLFSDGAPVALVEEADPFVTRYRDRLEDHTTADQGLVVLDVKSMPANTRLAKAVLAHGLMIRCQTPDRGAELTKHRRNVSRWLQMRAKETHDTTLESEAVDRLLDLLPLELGLLDQEVARLALLVGENESITAKLVGEHVGSWRVRTAWEMIDAVVEGRAADALGQLDRLLNAGEQPIGVLAQLGSTLRKFAAAAAAVELAEQSGRRPSLTDALARAGIPKFKLAEAQSQLRQIGRERAKQLTDWVLRSDLALKGYNSSPARARIELERLIVRLAREASPTSTSR